MKEVKISKGLICLVDDDDFEAVSNLKWFAVKKGNNFYAQRVDYHHINGALKGRTCIMHRFILGITDKSTVVDHIDHNTLNNQKYNLRACTQGQNCINTSSHIGSSSKFRGISWDKERLKWQAQIKHGDRRYSKRFKNEIDAALWYNVKSKEFHGEFGNINKI